MRSPRFLAAVLGIATALGLGTASTLAQAQDVGAAPAALAGDAARGAKIGETCLGCHGIPHYKNAYPSYDVPKLRGQNADYLVSALTAYRSQERSHVTMHAQAASMSDQDLADLAAYFAGPPLKSAGAAAGGANTPPASAQVCVACHGNDGIGISPQYPNLAGQYEDYLVRALTDYRKGGRKNAIMASFASQLDDGEIAELAAYYSSRTPALDTPPRRRTAFAAK
jgi:cytochrome c553